ncbi:MAG TPA: hypothetical protein VIJ79_00055 [Acidobacteriaceae bacterium]
MPKYSPWMGRQQIFRQGWSAQFMLLLDQINQEVQAYEKATSPMAKRTIAIDLQGKIAAFEKAWKKAYVAPFPKDLVELRTAALEQSAGVSVSAHKYQYAICIAYQVGTGKFSTTEFIAHWNGVKHVYNSLVDYSGDTRDHADAAIRIGRMKEAIEAAFQCHRSHYQNDPNDTKTLKIFMAPEFYFRGLYGAYDICYVSRIFAELRNFTKDAKFKDWLFVFGTVIAASFDDRLVCDACGKRGATQFKRIGHNRYACASCPPDSVKEQRLGATIDNVALIQKGGEGDDKNSYLVEKEYVSHIDFKRHMDQIALNKGKAATGYATGVGIVNDWDADRRIQIRGTIPGTSTMARALPVPGSRDVHGSASKFTDERMGGSIFTMDGIKFGLEICLDHLLARVPAGSGIQIQLVPSAGASLVQFACVPQGIAFNVDGGDAGSSDVRINDSGAVPSGSGTLATNSSSVSGGGEVVVYAPHAIPWA